MFALAAAVVFLLDGFGVLDDTQNVRWLPIGLALLAIHFIFDPWTLPWRRP